MFTQFQVVVLGLLAFLLLYYLTNLSKPKETLVYVPYYDQDPYSNTLNTSNTSNVKSNASIYSTQTPTGVSAPSSNTVFPSSLPTGNATYTRAASGAPSSTNAAYTSTPANAAAASPMSSLSSTATTASGGPAGSADASAATTPATMPTSTSIPRLSSNPIPSGFPLENVSHSIPVSINTVPFVSQFGVTTGNPLDDTPLLFTQNDVISLWSNGSKGYLNLVPVQDALATSTPLNHHFPYVVEASSPNALRDKNAQWIVRQGTDRDQFPESMRLENVGFPGVFLKGFRLAAEPTQHIIVGWQPSAGQTSQSDLYATMLKHIIPGVDDTKSLVLFSSLLASFSPVLDHHSNVYLLATSDGSVGDPREDASIEQVAWQLRNIGRVTVDGRVVYADGSLPIGKSFRGKPSGGFTGRNSKATMKHARNNTKKDNFY